MASSFESFRNLDLSRDEVDRIGEALKDKEFRKLFADYVEEIRDPENRKLFEKEITELEKERGIDVTFINPVAGYVIKSSVDGSKKAFINICSNEHIKKPSSSPSCIDGSRGLTWSLPHSLSPPREDIDNKRVRCQVFDVVFHPDTLHLAQNNAAFRNMVNKTACEAIESNFNVNLDTKNLKFPKLQFKGMPHATIIRKSTNEKPTEKSPEDQAILDKIYENIPKQQQPPQSPKKHKKLIDNRSKYTTPKYTIKHRSHIELENFTYERTAKINSAIPKELVIEIDLPMLKSAGDISLDVTEKSVQLISEKPAKYKLSLTLPYQVNQDCGNAKFEKDSKKLLITLPVKRNMPSISDFSREDSGVESDHGSPISTPPRDEPLELTFLEPNIHYTLPEYIYHSIDNILTYTLNVKNVHEESIEKCYNDISSSIHVKFTSMSTGFFPIYYAFYVKLPEHFIDTEKVSIEAWDNNVVVQIAFKPCDKQLTTYLVGMHEGDASLKQIEDKIPSKPTPETSLPIPEFFKTKEVQKANIVLDTVALKDEPKNKSIAIDIVGAYSESSGDEMSLSYSPSKSKGILKRNSSARSSVSRSISESSIDDLMWASSFENCYNSMDSVIPEEGELSASMKKTVRFNDNVSRQLFRSNSSILGQKKKNQRKAKNKKRAAQERRYSESELSECDEKKEREPKTTPCNGEQPDELNNKKEDNNIFDFDM